eukprot:TRINITY_DN12472_c0_g1_i1.p1 TRINITY_DN12472_c0_g1~~TRINITY_DN12472_c0_g1_i1.p1  ORF type:complete len:1023 (-),score=182.06 TRINITY_DN12472_c0_g1_i1:133-3201(-)
MDLPRLIMMRWEERLSKILLEISSPNESADQMMDFDEQAIVDKVASSILSAMQNQLMSYDPSVTEDHDLFETVIKGFVKPNTNKSVPCQKNDRSLIELSHEIHTLLHFAPGLVDEESRLYDIDFSGTDYLLLFADSPSESANRHSLSIFDQFLKSPKIKHLQLSELFVNSVIPQEFKADVTLLDSFFRKTANFRSPSDFLGIADVDLDEFQALDLGWLKIWKQLCNQLLAEHHSCIVPMLDQMYASHQPGTPIVLSLSHLRIFNCPSNLYRFVDLVSLDLSRNQLSALDDNFGFLANLRFLNLSYNRFSTLPVILTRLQRLESLLLHGNPVFSKIRCFIPASQTSQQLQSNMMAFFTSLQQNTSTHNPLFNQIFESLPLSTIEPNGSLRPWSEVLHIPWFSLSSLTSLVVSRNEITYLPDSLWTLAKLRHLDASFNHIKFLSPNIVHACDLEILNLEGNPLIFPVSNLESVSVQSIQAAAQPFLLCLEADAESQKKDHESSKSMYENVLSQAPNCIAAMIGLRRCLTYQPRLVVGPCQIDPISELLKKIEQSPEADLKLSEAYFRWRLTHDILDPMSQGMVLAMLGFLFDVGMKQPSVAHPIYLEACELGDAAAQCNLGYCYYYGLGVEKSLKEAVKWYKLAASQNYAIAQSNLGNCYDNGNGVSKDPEAAFKWYQSSANLGSAFGIRSLGNCFFNGNCVDKDLERSFRLYFEAANLGDASAQSNLANCYFYGEGVDQDRAEAIKWYKLSAKQGDAYAQCYLGDRYYRGEGVVKNIDEAVRWYRLSANQNNDWGMCQLAFRYFLGEGVDKDHVEAFRLAKLSSEKGNTGATFLLAVCHEEGYGVKKNPVEAIKIYRTAAKKGHTDSQVRLGHQYYTGTHVAQDYDEAFFWYRCAAFQRNSEGERFYGLCFYQGHGTTQNLSTAFEWFLSSAKRGNTSSQYWTSICYLNGHGVDRNRSIGLHWLKQAASLGHAEAQRFLANSTQELRYQSLHLEPSLRWRLLLADGNDQTSLNALNRSISSSI